MVLAFVLTFKIVLTWPTNPVLCLIVLMDKLIGSMHLSQPKLSTVETELALEVKCCHDFH